MKNKSLNTIISSTIVFSGFVFVRCSIAQTKSYPFIKKDAASVEHRTLTKSMLETMEKSIYLKSKESSPEVSERQYLCGTVEVPRFLKELNRNDIYTSNISTDVNTSLSAFGFLGKMGKKDILQVAYLTKYKDFTCGGATKRVQVGLKLYVHASNLKVKVNSPSLSVIAAATELGLAKAEYKLETFGINPENFYTKLPSAQFQVETYAKVIAIYDDIVRSLEDSTVIDPIILDITETKF